MKNKTLLAGMLVLTVMFIGCSTASIQYDKMDKSKPSREQALLYIHKDAFIRVFDGEKGVMGSGQALPYVYVIAPGKHEFSVDWGHPYILARNIKMSYVFEAGRFYYMHGEKVEVIDEIGYTQNTKMIYDKVEIRITDETNSTDPELVKIREYVRANLK